MVPHAVFKLTHALALITLIADLASMMTVNLVSGVKEAPPVAKNLPLDVWLL